MPPKPEAVNRVSALVTSVIAKTLVERSVVVFKWEFLGRSDSDPKARNLRSRSNGRSDTESSCLCRNSRNNRKGVPQAYVRACASSATLCCTSLSKRASDTYQNGLGYITDTYPNPYPPVMVPPYDYSNFYDCIHRSLAICDRDRWCTNQKFQKA